MSDEITFNSPEEAALWLGFERDAFSVAGVGSCIAAQDADARLLQYRARSSDGAAHATYKDQLYVERAHTKKVESTIEFCKSKLLRAAGVDPNASADVLDAYYNSDLYNISTQCASHNYVLREALVAIINTASRCGSSDPDLASAIEASRKVL